MSRRHQLLWLIGIIAVLLIGARAALPAVVRDYANEKLHGLKAYDGHVGDVDLSLWRGAYRLRDVRIVKRGAEHLAPFFNGPRIDISVEWRSLLHGSLVAEGVFSKPNVNLVQGRNEQQSQTGKEENWPRQIEKLFPFRFNTIRVHDGMATFQAPGIRTQDALKATTVEGEISNLTNVIDRDQETFAEFRGTARVLDDGSARINGSLNPLAQQPTFDVNLTVKNVQLPKVNPWLREYIKADAESGEFELYTELAAADGKFKGYAKPIMRDVKIAGSEEPESNPLRRLWEGVVQLTIDVLKSKDSGQVAARIPFSGTVRDPDAGILQTIVSVLHNAFVSAFARSLEGSISLRDVKKSLEGIGGRQASEEDRKKGSKAEGDAEKKSDKPPFRYKRIA